MTPLEYSSMLLHIFYYCTLPCTFHYVTQNTDKSMFLFISYYRNTINCIKQLCLSLLFPIPIKIRHNTVSYLERPFLLETNINVYNCFMHYEYSGGVVFYPYCFFSLQVKIKLPDRIIFYDLLQ